MSQLTIWNIYNALADVSEKDCHEKEIGIRIYTVEGHDDKIDLHIESDGKDYVAYVYFDGKKVIVKFTDEYEMDFDLTRIDMDRFIHSMSAWLFECFFIYDLEHPDDE